MPLGPARAGWWAQMSLPWAPPQHKLGRGAAAGSGGPRCPEEPGRGSQAACPRGWQAGWAGIEVASKSGQALEGLNSSTLGICIHPLAEFLLCRGPLSYRH